MEWHKLNPEQKERVEKYIATLLAEQPRLYVTEYGHPYDKEIRARKKTGSYYRQRSPGWLFGSLCPFLDYTLAAQENLG